MLGSLLVYYIDENDPECLFFFCLHLPSAGTTSVPTTSNSYGARDGIQGFVNATSTLKTELHP